MSVRNCQMSILNKCHDTFVKTKVTLSCLKGRYCNIKLMMFYLKVFYSLKLRNVIRRYEMWHQQKFWFMQICYNVHILLLIKQANDVEENPGPKLLDIIDPSKTVCADYSQGNQSLFGENAGSQCVVMSPIAILYRQIKDVNLWTCSTMNDILISGNNLYSSIRCYGRSNDLLLLTDLPKTISFSNRERKSLLSFLIFLDPSPGLLSVDIFSMENRTLSDIK